MRKRIISAICVIIVTVGLTLLIGQIFFKFHNTSYEITEEEIKNRALINEITNEVYEDCFAKGFSGDEAEKYITEYHRPTEYDEVVNELARSELINSILTSEGCALNYDEAKQTTDREYQRMKNEETSAEYYKSLKAVLNKHNITEDQYLNLTYDYAYDIYSETNFNAWFLKNKYKYDSDARDPELEYAEEYPGKDEQINAYLDKAMKKVKVIIK